MARRTTPKPTASAFDGMRSRKIEVTLGTRRRKLDTETALQLKTFEEALEGKVGASRAVLGWIVEREEARSGAIGSRKLPMIIAEKRRTNSIDEASRLLGIASDKIDQFGFTHLTLENWTVQQALDRSPSIRLTEKNIKDLKFHVCDPDAIFWPEAFIDDQ